MKTDQTIKNRHNLSLVIAAYTHEKPQGLVFLQHGLTGYKEHLPMQAMLEVFLQHKYDAITFDATHSFGASEGALENFTPTTLIHDLEDVIAWAAAQEFYREKFVLAGHSMGGFSILHYALRHPEKITALAPVACSLSGRLFAEAAAQQDPVLYAQWQNTGSLPKSRLDNPAINGRMSWRLVEDFYRYDILDDAARLTMPVLLIVGDQDTTTPLVHQRLLYDALTCDKQLHVIPGASHAFRGGDYALQLQNYLSSWLDMLPKNA